MSRRYVRIPCPIQLLCLCMLIQSGLWATVRMNTLDEETDEPDFGPPDPDCESDEVFKVVYANTRVCNLGADLSTALTKKPPAVTLSAANHNYSSVVLMEQNNDKLDIYWFVVNIPSGADSSAGQEFIAYRPPKADRTYDIHLYAQTVHFSQEDQNTIRKLISRHGTFDWTSEGYYFRDIYGIKAFKSV